MDIQNITNLLIGAIVGVALENAIPFLYKKYMDRRNVSKINERKLLLENSERIYNWLIKYYTIQGNQNDLYDCKIGRYEVKIPFITTKQWQNSFPILPKGNKLLHYSDTAKNTFHINTKLINMRQQLGQRLTNQAALYLDRIESSEKKLALYVKSCNYFQIATSFIQLEEETFQAIQKNNYMNLPVRDAYISNAKQVEQLLKKPFAIGCSFVFALKTKKSYEIILHTRSLSTATFGSTKAATPNFGFMPVVGGHDNLDLFYKYNSSNKKNYEFDLIYYNLIKEYLEELYNYEELIDPMTDRKVDPHWFYKLPEAMHLKKLIDKNKFKIEFLGFGFDALNGCSVIALLGKIDDDEYSEKLRNSFKLNWEFAEKDKYLDIELIDIKSNELEKWLRESKYHTGAAFAISKAIQKLKKDL